MRLFLCALAAIQLGLLITLLSVNADPVAVAVVAGNLAVNIASAIINWKA